MKLNAGKPLHDLAEDIEAALDSADLFFGHSTQNAWEEAAWIGLYATKQDIGAASDDDIDAPDFDWEVQPSDDQVALMQSLVDERIKTRKPLAYLVKEAWFSGLRFYVDERAIVPRSYFGEWINDQFSPWLDASKVKTALDLCTGTGCIAIALAYAFPDAHVDATELSEDALAVARINVDKHKLEDRVSLYQGDLFGELSGTYDLICSNPPYISNQRMDNLPAEYLEEPDMAFRGGELGLDIVDRMLAEAVGHLNPGGVLIVEVGTSALDLEAQYPRLPFTWLSTADEAMALFMLSREELLSGLA